MLKTPKISIILSLMIFTLAFLPSPSFSALPIAYFHGFTADCPDKQYIIQELAQKLNTYVECIVIGDGKLTSMFVDLRLQSEEACRKIQDNPHFQDDFSIVAESQGNLIARYIIQKCEMKGKVKRFLSMHGPHMGLAYIPKTDYGEFMDVFNHIALEILIKVPFFTKIFAPASYMKTRYNQDLYLKYNKFLVDLNNEGEIKNEEYKKRFSSLDKLMLIKTPYDATIRPPRTAWFEYYDESGEIIVDLKDSKFYIDDYIGLRKLDEEGKVEFENFYENHCRYTTEEMDRIMVRFLK